MSKTIIMPRQGQSVESCILTKRYIEVGDSVDVGDLLFAYETDKASFEEESEYSGILLKWLFNEGDEVPVLNAVCYIGKEGEEVEEVKEVDKVETVDKVDKVEAVDKAETVDKSRIGNELRISPRAKRMADERGISIGLLNGTGPGGRIIARDIEEFVVPSSADTSSDSYTLEPLTNIRKLIAKAMFTSLQNSAQLTHHLGADARRMLKLREKVKENKGKSGYTNITINDMVSYAVVRALKEFPRVNAHLHGDDMKLFRKVNLGMAVDTDRGLMVPSISNAGEMNINQLSLASSSVAEQCRKGSVDPDIISPENASFTISNLGNYGVEMFTPVINLPQVAILGVNTILNRPVDIGDGVIAFVPYLGLSLTYDHRALDGGEATRFLKQVAIEIENIELS